MNEQRCRSFERDEVMDCDWWVGRNPRLPWACSQSPAHPLNSDLKTNQ